MRCGGAPMLRAFRSLLLLLALCSAAFLAPPLAQAAEQVDLLLVFAADVSGSIDQPKFQLQREGSDTAGRDVTLARDEAVAQGVTINGLVILSERPMAWNPEHTNPPGGLANYYRTNVVGGSGAFVIVAEDFNSFGQAIIKKLI